MHYMPLHTITALTRLQYIHIEVLTGRIEYLPHPWQWPGTSGLDSGAASGRAQAQRWRPGLAQAAAGAKTAFRHGRTTLTVTPHGPVSAVTGRARACVTVTMTARAPNCRHGRAAAPAARGR